MTKVLLIVVSVVFMVLRLFVTPETPTMVDVYKDAVHIFMGGLFICCIRDKKPWLWWLFGVLCVWELAISLGSRLIG